MNKVLVIMTFSLLASAALAQGQEQMPSEEPADPTVQEQQPANESEQEQGIRYIAAKDAINHVGETVAVCGTVATGVYSRRSQTKNTYLNFDKPFPDNTFTAIIARKNRKHFEYKPEKLEGQWICVYGLITSYQGKAEVQVVIPEQIVAKEYPD